MIVRGSKCEVPQPFASSPIIPINRVNIYNTICFNMFNIVMIRKHTIMWKESHSFLLGGQAVSIKKNP